MNKFLLLCGVALCSASLCAQATEAVRFAGSTRHLTEAQLKSRAEIKNNIRRATANAYALWRPGTITYYDWMQMDETNGMWSEGRPTTFTYDAAGLVLTSNNDNEYIEYTYDSLNRMTSMTTYGYNGTEKMPYSKQEYFYDSVVENLMVKTLTYFYENGQAMLREGDQTVITRNSDGNVTKVTTSRYISWSDTPYWEEEELVEITYGADKKANTIRMSFYDYDSKKYETEAYLTDIVWDATDGQIVFFDTDEADFFMGANRIKTAKGPKADNYPYAGDIYYSVTYKENNGGYVMTANMNNALYMSADYSVLDQYGSYKMMEYEIDYDSEDDVNYVPDEPQLQEYTVIYDAYGLKTLEQEQEYVNADVNAGVDYCQKTVGTVVYDTTYGYPLEYTTEFSTVSSDYNYSSKGQRQVFSNYVDLNAGVGDISVDDANAPVEYYNLQGVRVANPESGLYIRRQGRRTTKVVF